MARNQITTTKDGQGGGFCRGKNANSHEKKPGKNHPILGGKRTDPDVRKKTDRERPGKKKVERTLGLAAVKESKGLEQRVVGQRGLKKGEGNSKKVKCGFLKGELSSGEKRHRKKEVAALQLSSLERKKGGLTGA